MYRMKLERKYLFADSKFFKGLFATTITKYQAIGRIKKTTIIEIAATCISNLYSSI